MQLCVSNQFLPRVSAAGIWNPSLMVAVIPKNPVTFVTFVFRRSLSLTPHSSQVLKSYQNIFLTYISNSAT